MIDPEPPLRVGVVGAGAVSEQYLSASRFFANFQIACCADVVPERAGRRAAEFGIQEQSVEALIVDESIDIVLNLTNPANHFEITHRALVHGKHVYSEKPLAAGLPDAKTLLEVAAERGCSLGCAPDTFLGGTHQTARHLLDTGLIGTPFAATAFFFGGGPERWHPTPEFLYRTGAGPALDMGPYYLTALVDLFGPVRKLSSRRVSPEPRRIIGAGGRKNQELESEVPTTLMSILEFQSGVIATIGISFDVYGHSHPPIEIYGTAGTLALPDPNRYGGNLLLSRRNKAIVDVSGTTGCWEIIEPGFGFTAKNYRGLGLAECVSAISQKRAPRTSGALAYHVLEVLQAITVAGEFNAVPIDSSCCRPERFNAEEDLIAKQP